MTDAADLSEQRKALIDQGRFADARAVTGRMLEQDPSNPVLHGQMAWLLAALRDFKGAIEHQEKAVALAPRNAGIQTALLKYLNARAEQIKARLEPRTALSGPALDEKQDFRKANLYRRHG